MYKISSLGQKIHIYKLKQFMAIQFYPATLKIFIISFISIEAFSQDDLKCTQWTASKSSYSYRNHRQPQGAAIQEI